MRRTREASAPALIAEATVALLVLAPSNESTLSCSAAPATPNTSLTIAPTPLSLSRSPATVSESSFDCVRDVNEACSAPR